MKLLTQLALALPVAAWPASVMREIVDTMDANTMDVNLVKRGKAPTVPPPKFSSGRDNCGIHGPCLGFSEEDQFVDVSDDGPNAFQAPTSSDLRGQCPGLNAAANHGFGPRNGIWTILQTVTALGDLYNMSPDLSGALAVLSIAICGDPVSGTWSIGGEYPGAISLLGNPTGILGTHNRYEGDASIVRGDAYMYNGNVDVFEMQKWNYLYSLVGDNFSHDKAAKMAYWTSQYSVLNNPYYFSAPFSGLVAPDAHNFIVSLMSNHSAAVPGGTLDGETLKQFFAVTGSPGKFKHHKYQERVPYDWYKRPTANAFTAVDTNADTVLNNQIYPGVIRFGGNTGKKNSFAGIDFADFTGGVYNSKNLAKGNNLACFMYQAAQQGLLDFAAPGTEPLGQLVAFLNKNLGKYLKPLNCPAVAKFDDNLFAPFPGAKYTGN